MGSGADRVAAIDACQPRRRGRRELGKQATLTLLQPIAIRVGRKVRIAGGVGAVPLAAIITEAAAATKTAVDPGDAGMAYIRSANMSNGPACGETGGATEMPPSSVPAASTASLDNGRIREGA